MRTLFIISALTFGISLAWCDNTAGGGDMPWDGDDGDGGEPTAIGTPVTPDMPNPFDTPNTPYTLYTPDTPNTPDTPYTPVYDLQGRKVQTPQPGKIYIFRGKKFIWISK